MRCPITIAFLLATDGNITLVVVVVSFSREINNIAYAVKGACSVYAVQLCTSSRSAERVAIEFVDHLSLSFFFYFFFSSLSRRLFLHMTVNAQSVIGNIERAAQTVDACRWCIACRPELNCTPFRLKMDRTGRYKPSRHIHRCKHIACRRAIGLAWVQHFLRSIAR